MEKSHSPAEDTQVQKLVPGRVPLVPQQRVWNCGEKQGYAVCWQIQDTCCLRRAFKDARSRQHGFKSVDFFETFGVWHLIMQNTRWRSPSFQYGLPKMAEKNLSYNDALLSWCYFPHPSAQCHLWQSCCDPECLGILFACVLLGLYATYPTINVDYSCTTNKTQPI